ncbi:peptide deformylase [Mycoplasmopsis agalactiae]|uniref:peptide deformylase n=1 Tax=Mycoplasmopsis agalactiae TaxID=2110 RepID=UPI001F876439|nr:peptide deformylase [Mycoplasmopsis agalactiae]MCE6056188.1 peptide deformylase [Mycoplasmopsis agalactiae]MCE6090840.1 peptide deformylase [Mycoplasmopsis agalactiae]UUM25705.1 peptide deformylase [Mycoplasmopsis agalactiae]
MSVYNVDLVKLPKKVLRKKSENVPIPLTSEDIELAKTMIYHIDDSQKQGSKFQAGVGVAAVQYGILKRVFYINITEDMVDDKSQILRDVFFNPTIIAMSNSKIALSQGEGCLSVGRNIPNQSGLVYRHKRIVIEAYSYFEKKIKRYDLSGYPAIVAQHELDHLEGKLFIDRIDNNNPWDSSKGELIY